MIFRFDDYVKENDGGGVAAVTLSNTNGMGAVVSPTVGSTPGQIWGTGSGTKGSGDVSNVFGTYTKSPLVNSKKGKKKKKKIYSHEKLGANYQRMYITKFQDWSYYPEKKV